MNELGMRVSNPTPEQVKLIFKDTYNFYLKWIAVNEVDWGMVISESHEIEAKYPFELNRKILVEIVAVIQADYMGRSNNGN
jgi:hypothetical protein